MHDIHSEEVQKLSLYGCIIEKHLGRGHVEIVTEIIDHAAYKFDPMTLQMCPKICSHKSVEFFDLYSLYSFYTFMTIVTYSSKYV